MHAGRDFSPGPKARPRSSEHAWIGVAVGALDQHLRRKQGIVEYTNSPECIFRMQVTQSGHEIALSDGTKVSSSGRVIELHFWNEQLPSAAELGSALAWVRQMDRCARLSMGELARHLAHRPDLDDVRAIRANISLGLHEHTRQMIHLVRRYGFEAMPRPKPPKLRDRVHRLGENILITMLIAAHNSAALRADILWRSRLMVYLSRRVLEQRYGAGSGPSV